MAWNRETSDQGSNFTHSPNPIHGQDTGEDGGGPVFLIPPQYDINGNVRFRIRGRYPLTVSLWNNGSQVYSNTYHEYVKDIKLNIRDRGVYTVSIIDANGKRTGNSFTVQ